MLLVEPAKGKVVAQPGKRLKIHKHQARPQKLDRSGLGLEWLEEADVLFTSLNSIPSVKYCRELARELKNVNTKVLMKAKMRRGWFIFLNLYLETCQLRILNY